MAGHGPKVKRKSLGSQRGPKTPKRSAALRRVISRFVKGVRAQSRPVFDPPEARVELLLEGHAPCPDGFKTAALHSVGQGRRARASLEAREHGGTELPRWVHRQWPD